MAKKKLEEPVKWITVNGKHLPVYESGRIGQPGQEEDKNSATAIGKMTKEERVKYLDEAPVGTKISGIYDLRTGNELTAEKQSGYSDSFGAWGRQKVESTEWYLGGVKQLTMARTIRQANDGTSPYYTTDKKKADAAKKEYEKKQAERKAKKAGGK